MELTEEHILSLVDQAKKNFKEIGLEFDIDYSLVAIPVGPLMVIPCSTQNGTVPLFIVADQKDLHFFTGTEWEAIQNKVNTIEEP